MYFDEVNQPAAPLAPPQMFQLFYVRQALDLNTQLSLEAKREAMVALFASKSTREALEFSPEQIRAVFELHFDEDVIAKTLAALQA